MIFRIAPKRNRHGKKFYFNIYITLSHINRFLRTPAKEPVMVESVKGPELKISLAGEGKKGADYDPSKKNYNPIKDAFWSVNEKYVYKT